MSSPTASCSEEFDIASTHMVLVDAVPAVEDRCAAMIADMEQVDGVKYVLGLESVVGARVPEEILPDSVCSYSQERQMGAAAHQLRVQGRERRSECPDRLAQRHSEEI